VATQIELSNNMRRRSALWRAARHTSSTKWLGNTRMPHRTVTVVKHRAAWSAEFEVIASDLRAVLANDALQVDHIGSTAVQALAAKDIIDIQVTVQTIHDGIAHRLLDAGFTTHSLTLRQDHLPPGFESKQEDWAKLFFMQRIGMRRCNIHVRQLGRPNQRYPLLIRDFLRADWRVAEAYGELKKRLAKTLAEPDTYPDVKDPVADIIYFAAERWALETRWQSQPAASPL
jgi:GrpB-like predicted nucleotidyltransferase (UPF0157 family)